MNKQYRRVWYNIKLGADFFSELFIYTCLLGIPLYEIYRSTRDTNKKSQILQDRLENIENVYIV